MAEMFAQLRGKVLMVNVVRVSGRRRRFSRECGRSIGWAFRRLWGDLGGRLFLCCRGGCV